MFSSVCVCVCAGGAVSEEKQKDVGHFNPLRHSHCSNSYSFWNKVLVLHSTVCVCFLCGCMLCLCVDLDLDLVLLKTKLTAFQTHFDVTGRVPCLLDCVRRFL